MSKHTAGPWDAWVGDAKYGMTGPAAAASMVAAGAIRRTEGYEVLLVELSSEYMECPGIALGDTRERAVANAYLIAAAPELLEALSETLAFCEANTFGGDDTAALIAKARAAIAKATGSTP